MELQHPHWKLDWQRYNGQDLSSAEPLQDSTLQVSGALLLLEDTGHQPAVNLGLIVRQQQSLHAEVKGIEANLQLKKTVLRHQHLGTATSIGASISYRRDEQRHAGIVEDGFGFHLTLQLDLNAG